MAVEIMKKSIMKGILIVLYLVLLFGMLDFHLDLLVNMKLFIFVVIGTLILGLLDVINNLEMLRVLARVKRNLIVTGAFTTFLSLLSSLPALGKAENVTVFIVPHFLGLFYGVLLGMLVDMTLGDVKLDTVKALPQNQATESQARVFEKYALTSREKMIAEALLEDLGNKEIGERYFISENTVKKHVQNIYRKTDVKSRVEFKYLFPYEQEMKNNE